MITGVILAGGLSSRMGEDKALLRIGGVSLLDRTADVLRAAGADTVVISGSRPGGIPDRWPQAGPVGGIASAAGSLPDGELLVVPVDMPRLDHAVLMPLLVDRSRAVSIWEGHPLPMRMTLDAACRAALAALMTQPGRACSMVGLQSRLGVTTLPSAAVDAGMLMNCNTPHEWQEANP